MFIWIGSKRKVKTVKGGEHFLVDCPNCDEETRFVECTVTDTFTAYSLVDLVDSTKTLYKCEECLELYEIEKKTDPVAEAKLRRLKEKRQRLKAAISRKQQAADQAKRAVAVESDLAKLKCKIGL